jgi:uncharacterized membrane protein YqhA
MLKNLLKIRFVFLIAVIFTLLNSIFCLAAGVISSIHGYTIFYNQGLNGAERPGVYLLEGLDLFLVSMVFLIFALGIIRIFTHYNTSEDENLPRWLRIKDFKELKILLWETILVTLVVFTFTTIISNKEVLKWDALIIPSVVLILMLSLFLMKRSEKH